MSFREKLAKAIAPKLFKPGQEPEAIPVKEVFAEGICDICQKQMVEHVDKDCRDVPIRFKDSPEAVQRLRARK